MTRLPASLVFACLAGCTLALDYAPLVEVSDAECHDGVDNDRDGLRDCDDDSCVRCVTPPAVRCPDGWTMIEVVGARVPTTSCAPPDDAFAGCVSEAPAGEIVIRASDDALGDYLSATVRPSDPLDGPPLVIWLAPGVHVESAVDITSHVVLHGLCDGATRATIRPAPTRGMPFTINSGHLEIDHVALEVQAGGLGPMGRGGAVDVSHCSVVPRGMDMASFEIGASVTARFDHVSSLASVHVLGGGFSAQQSLLGGVDGNGARVEISFSRVEGSVSVESPVGTLVLRSSFVQCGVVEAREAPATTIETSLIVQAPGSRSIWITGTGGGDLGTAAIHDVVVVTSTDCPTTFVRGPAGVDVATTTLDVKRLQTRTADPIGLRIALRSVAQLEDVDVERGLWIDDSITRGHRIRVPSALQSGIRVSGQSEAHLARVEVAEVPVVEREQSACTPYAAGMLFEGGEVDVTDAFVDRVSGCGVSVAPEVTLGALHARIDGAWNALCVYGRTDTAAIATGITVAEADAPLSEGVDLCFSPSCLPAGCLPSDEMGLCTNGIDDDGDELIEDVSTERHGIDCADSDCDHDVACERSVETNCTDARDEDRDGATDCADSDCQNTHECPVFLGPETGHCGDGVDNDLDGARDCQDVECACDPICAATIEVCPGTDLGSTTGVVVASGTLPEAELWCAQVSASCGGPTGASVAYRWTAPAAGDYTFSTGPGGAGTFDTLLQILDDCDGPELACDDSSLPMFFSSATVRLAARQAIIVRVREFSVGTHGTFSLSIHGP